MCKWGTDTVIHVIRRNNPYVPDGWHPMGVDSCIANYVQRMNDLGIVTLGCCCGHGQGPAWVQVAPTSIPRMERYGYAWHWNEECDRLDYVLHDIPPQPGSLSYPE